MPKRRVGAHQQARGQQLGQPFQRRADAGQLGGIAGVRAHVQRDPLGVGGLQHADLAGDAPVWPPALSDQRRALVGAGDPQGGQVQVQPGGVDPEPVDRGQGDRAADLLGHRGQRLQRAAEPVVVEQHPGDLQDLGHRRRARPTGHVVQRGGRGQPVGDQRGDHLAAGKLRPAALGQAPVHQVDQAEPVQVVGDQQQRTDLAAGAARRWVQPGEGGRELVELARRFELVLAAQARHHPVADLALLVPVGLDQPQVDVLPAAALDHVALHVHVGPTLRQCSPQSQAWMPVLLALQVGLRVHALRLRPDSRQPPRPLHHKDSKPPGSHRAPAPARAYPLNLRKTGLAGLPRTQAQPVFQEERGDEQHPEQHQVRQQACARSAEVRDLEARRSLRRAPR